MQALVKMPHIKINIKGYIPDNLLSILKKEYGNNLKIQNDDDPYIDISKTDWYKKMEKKMTPGKYLRIYRENNKLTQTELGKKLGGVPRQHISNFENDIRPIPVPLAKKMARLFDIPLERLV